MNVRDNEDKKAEATNIGSQESADTVTSMRRQLSSLWKRLSNQLKNAAFTPAWISAPWNHPLAGYLFAILMPATAILLTMLLTHWFPSFGSSGALGILAILVVAILWGTGPALFATLIGTILLNSLVFSPAFVFSFNIFQHIFETCLFLVIGIIISLVTSRIEHARTDAAAARIEAEELAARLGAEKEALHETKGLMDEFLGIASHELRTPLTTIKGNIQLAKMRLMYAARGLQAGNGTLQGDVAEIQMMLDRAERQVDIQNRLIRDLLDISRIQAGQLEFHQEYCNLVSIVRESVGDLQSATSARIIHLGLPSDESMPVFADPERITQVISNYVTNALKYSPAEYPVEVRLEKVEGAGVREVARLSVRDRGPGLTPSEQEHVWKRFYRIEGIQRQRGFKLGLGLGLHICQAIIEQHGGQVGVESDKGVGSTFWFTLPLTEKEY